MPTDVFDAINKARDAELKIAEILQNFEKESGVKIENINILRWTTVIGDDTVIQFPEIRRIKLDLKIIT